MQINVIDEYMKLRDNSLSVLSGQISPTRPSPQYLQAKAGGVHKHVKKGIASLKNILVENKVRAPGYGAQNKNDTHHSQAYQDLTLQSKGLLAPVQPKYCNILFQDPEQSELEARLFSNKLIQSNIAKLAGQQRGPPLIHSSQNEPGPAAQEQARLTPNHRMQRARRANNTNINSHANTNGHGHVNINANGHANNLNLAASGPTSPNHIMKVYQKSYK